MKDPSDVKPEMAQQLLASFSLYPGMTLAEAARGYIEDNRRHIDPSLIQFVAACAIQAGMAAFAAALLGRDVVTGEKLPPSR